MGLSITQAKELIAELKERDIARGRNPDTWYTYENHILGAAQVAKTIASKITSMDSNQAYVNALLHDISRTEERAIGRFHGILGYEKLLTRDEQAACAALVHMFPWGKIGPYEKYAQMFFDNKKDYDFVADYLSKTPMKDDDLLIQLADGLANKNGIVTLEQRAQEYAERRGIPLSTEMQIPYKRLKAYFDNKLGCNLYNLFFTSPLPNRECEI